MRLLLDTHAFLWYVFADSRLGASARAAIDSPSNRVEISPAVYCEIAIKVGIGKPVLSQPYPELIRRGIYTSGFKVLPILPQHTELVSTLPFHHREPFDRMLIAQAMVENASIINCDPLIGLYPITCIW